jgi:tetratricopeptide (TPR) repeat protein
MRAAAERAAAIDADAASTLHALANVARAETRFADAQALYLRGQQADPTYPDVREDYAELLNALGRYEDSLIEARRLLELEPFVAVFWWRLGEIGAHEDRRDLVEEARERARAIDPALDAGVLGGFWWEFVQGRLDPARAALAEAMRFAPAVAAREDKLFRWSERAPDVDDDWARRTIMGRPDYTPFAAHRGDVDLFFAALEGEPEAPLRYDFFNSISIPIARPLLADPRAKLLLVRYGFVAYWREKGWPALCRPLSSDDFECGPVVRKD